MNSKKRYKDLSDEEIKAIIELWKTKSNIYVAEKFNISKHTVTKIISKDIDSQIIEYQKTNHD